MASEASNSTATGSPRVTIGLAVFNGERHIRGAIESLLAQTFTDFELIISDNCSTDGTLAICQGYATRDPRVRVSSRPANLGMGRNVEFVLQAGSGEFIMWACDDDRWHPDFVASGVRSLDADSTAVAVFSHVILHNYVTSQDTLQYCYPSLHESPERRLLHRIVQGGNSVWFSIFRRSALMDHVARGLQYDFFDVLIVYALTIKGRILIENRPLFICGIKTPLRIAYSITHKHLNYSNAIRQCLSLIWREFGAGSALALSAFAFLGFVVSWSKERKSRRRAAASS